MLKRVQFSILLLFTLFRLTGQEGGAYIYNYLLSDFNETPVITQIVQNNRGAMFFLSQSGLIKYDGASWDLIHTENTPIKIYAGTSSDKLFIVDESGIGFFNRNNRGEYQYSNIIHYEVDSITNVHIKNINDKLFVWFSGEFFIINIADQKLEFNKRFDATINKCLVFENTIVLNVNDAEETCFQYNGKSVEQVAKPSFFNYGDILFNFPYNDSLKIIGTSNSSLLLCTENSVMEHIEIDYLQNNYLTDGIELTGREIALSTLSGGIILVDKTSRETIEVINFQTGLPDDEIKFMFKDNAGGLWVSHGLGLSKVELYIPVRNMGTYPGILGEKTSVSLVNGRIYVGTNEGLFYLSKVKYTNEIRHYIKKEAKVTQNIETFSVLREVKRVIRLKAFHDPGEGNEQGVREIPITFKVPVDSVVSKVTNVFKDSVVRDNYARMSIPSIYKRVNGINARCNSLTAYRDNSLLVATNTGLWYENNLEVTPLIEKDNITKVYILADTNTIYALSESKLYRLHFDANNQITEKRISELPNKKCCVAVYKNEVLFSSDKKIFKIDNSPENPLNNIGYHEVKSFDNDVEIVNSQGNTYIIKQNQLFLYNENIPVSNVKNTLQDKSEAAFIHSQNNFLWVKGDNKFKLVNSGQKDFYKYLNLFRNPGFIYIDDSSNLWVINNNQLYCISENKEDEKNAPFNIEVSKISDDKGNGLDKNEIKLSYSSNSLNIFISPNYYLSEKGIRYSHFMEGKNKEWTSWSEDPKIDYEFLPPGKYNILVRAINTLGEVSETKPIPVFVKKPFWSSVWFMLLMAITLFFLSWLFSYIRTKKLEKANRILQEKIQKATAEIVEQKDKLEIAYADIGEKNRHITQSINYAQRIQEGVSVKADEIKQVIPEFFLVNSPMDIVSGDFYWFHDSKEHTIIIAADCTGHGVPGAFMSMIGNALLNQIIKLEKITDPGLICKRLDEEIIKTLHQDTNSGSYDGMDISVCKYIKKDNVLDYCGAMNSLFYIKNKKLEIVEPERYSLGGDYGIEKKFTTKTIKAIKNSYVYIYSDGFQDQLGGPLEKPKKFMSRNFKVLLESIHQLEANMQKQILEGELKNWLGNRGQNDDILIIGFKL